jgi:glycine cleavage system H protein
MNLPSNLSYTKSHEWVKVSGSVARVGVTDFAQHELTDIVFVELPKENSVLAAGKNCVVLESVKTAADVYSPVSGRVIKVNSKAAEAPEVVNHDPYGEGWLFEVEMSNSNEIDNLLTAAEYEQMVK